MYTNRASKNTSFGGYHPHAWDTFLEDLQQTKTLTMEMESAAVLVLTRLFGLRGGVILINVVNFTKTETKKKTTNLAKDADYSVDNVDRLCTVANEIMYQIYLNDRQMKGF